MKHKIKVKILSREVGPRKALLKNLAKSLIIHQKIKTTKAKAKALKPFVEKLITISKSPTLSHRRKFKAIFQQEEIIKKMFEVIGPKYKDRPGGYTRIIKIGRRTSDKAEMAVIELV